ncbi:TIGR00282 family metallophosphoesterase [Rubeoparvulum massiliense]|uniref:TIGR00282 family metallophosphoesterase n=1 Tax=Rubeoparvulum massiliense TaxID=1631346 RepID=UPI00065E5D10|nr:TIGR00282 family metallophosphoesterase [Rubeoparvulum massiliense]
MNILMIGDVCGQPGRRILEAELSQLRKTYSPLLTIVNGENAAGGRGINKKIAQQMMEWGTQVITLGNHAFDNRELFDFIDESKTIVRPLNYPPDTPGHGYTIVNMNGTHIAVVNLLGRSFMQPMDDPFRAMDHLLEEIKGKADYIIVDFHAETTSEKEAMGWYLDGRVHMVIGTHTHVQTADERILPKGTAYLTDVGMTGPRDSVLGMETEQVLKRFITQLPIRFEVASGPAQLNAVSVTFDPKTKRALRMERIQVIEEI